MSSDNQHPGKEAQGTTGGSTHAELRADAKRIAHDAKNAVGLIWMHLASLERLCGQDAGAREDLNAVKDETREIVRLMSELSERAQA